MHHKHRKKQDTAWLTGGTDLEPEADGEAFDDDIVGGEDGGAVPGAQWRSGEGSDTCDGDERERREGGNPKGSELKP